jgi:hypothetical protein
MADLDENDTIKLTEALALLCIKEPYIKKAYAVLNSAEVPFTTLGHFTSYTKAAGSYMSEYAPVLQLLENLGLTVKKRTGTKNTFDVYVTPGHNVACNRHRLDPQRRYECRIYIARTTLRGSSHYSVSPSIVHEGPDKWFLFHDAENMQTFLITHEELDNAKFDLLHGKKIPCISWVKSGGCFHITLSRRQTRYCLTERIKTCVQGDL